MSPRGHGPIDNRVPHRKVGSARHTFVRRLELCFTLGSFSGSPVNCFRGILSQDDPGTPLGQAITKRYFDPEGPPVQTLLAWMVRLFA